MKTTEESAENKTIKIWAYGKYAEIARQAVEAASSKGVEGDFITEEKTKEEIEEALANCGKEDLPDIISVSNSDIKKYLTGYTKDKFGIVEGYMDMSMFTASALKNVKDEEDVVYGCPVSTEPVGLYYRRDILGTLSEGINWDEFIEIGKTLKEEGKYLLPPYEILTEILMRSKGSLFYNDATNVSAEGSIEVIELVQRLSGEGLLYSCTSENMQQEIIEKMQTEEILSIIGGPEWFSIIKNHVGGEWGVTRIPKDDNFTNEADLGGYSWMVINKEDLFDQSHVYNFLSSLFYYHPQNNEAYKELTRYSAESLDIVPAIYSSKEFLKDLNNNEGFGSQQVIAYLLEISAEVPEVYLGEYAQELANTLNVQTQEVLDGNNTANDAYCEIEDEYYRLIEVIPKILDYIEIERGPSKTEYYKYESFDPAGMKVKAYFTDGTSRNITVSDFTPNIMLNTTRVTVFYSSGGVTVSDVTEEFNVLERSLISIEISCSRNDYFYGETPQKSDFTVNGIFDEGPSTVLDSSCYSFSYECFCGYFMITISINNMSIEGSINIAKLRKLESICVNKPPHQRVYKHKEPFKKAGMTLLAKYNNGTSEEISALDISTDYLVKFVTGKDTAAVKITYEENDIKKETTLEVYKKQGIKPSEAKVYQEISASGAGYVNLSSGEFGYIHTDFATMSTNIPLKVTHVYSPYNVQKEYKVGNNWRLNLQQELLQEDTKWYYIDKEGTKHSFEEIKDSSGEIKIQNQELGLELIEDDAATVKITDRANNLLVFTKIEKKYRLTSVYQYPTSLAINQTEISYCDDGRIKEVKSGETVDGKHPTVTFEYNEGGLLSELKYSFVNKSEETAASYTYDDSGNLTEITKRTVLAEDLIVLNITKFCYDYSSETGSFSVTEQSGTDTADNAKSLKYKIAYNKVSNIYVNGTGEEEETTIAYYSKSASNATDIMLTTVLKHGNIMSVYSFSELGVVSQYKCDTGSNTSGEYFPERIYSASSNGFDYGALSDSYADSLDVIYEDFEEGTEGWQNGGIFANGVTGNSQSLCYVKSETSANKLSKIYEGLKGLVYFSCWVKGKDVKIEADYGADNTVTHNVGACTPDYWQYAAVCLGYFETPYDVTVNISGDGDIQVDNVRIVKMPYVAPENIPDPEYDDSGKVTKSSSYNPIDQKIYTSVYEYNVDGKITLQTVSSEGEQVSSTEYVYNAVGQLTEVKTYGSGSEYVRESYAYDENTGRLTSYTDCNGVVTEYGYGVDYDQITLKGTPNIVVTNKYFTDTDILASVVMGRFQNGFEYNDKGYLSKVNYRYNETDKIYGSAVEYSYDGYGNLNNVKVGGVEVVSFTYDDKHLISQTLAKDHTTEYTYDDKDRLKEVKEHSKNTETETTATITYDDANDKVTVTSGGATYTSQQVNKDGITSSYQVSLNNKTLKAVGKALSIAEKVKRTTEEYYLDGNTTPFEKVVSSTDALGRLTEIERKYDGAKQVISTYTYDSLNRVTQKVTDYIGFLLGDYITDYTYCDMTSKQKTARIASETCRFDKKELGKFEYTYYPNGNVAKIYKDNTLVREYTYDEYDRLEWEKNFATSIAYNYEYDGSGNILEKRIHTISYVYDNNGNVISKTIKQLSGEAIDDASNQYYAYTYDGDKLTYTYDGDKLTKVTSILSDETSENEISYDNLGNITGYKDNTITWQGQRAVSINGIEMQYDYNGLRTRKGERYYYWLGNTLKMERWGENTIYYYYDESGISGFRYDDKEYYYHKNIFGDVVAIYDKNKDLQATYEYDAWGNHKIYNQNGAEINKSTIHIGNINPIRYRGYYWDVETQLFYCNSRYYSPELCRFISPDSIEYLDPESINGLNLYAYCNNDPINKYDPSGHFAISLLVGLAVSFVIGSAASAISQYVQYGDVNWLQVGVDGLFAVASTALAYTGIGLIGSIAAGAGMGLAQYTLDSAVFHDDFSWSGALIATGLGALGGLASGRGAQHFKSIGSNLDDTGRTGVKAILTAFDKYGTGAGYQKVMNLWGGRVANSLAKSISQNFTKSALIIWGTTAATYGASYWLGKINWGL